MNVNQTKTINRLYKKTQNKIYKRVTELNILLKKIGIKVKTNDEVYKYYMILEGKEIEIYSSDQYGGYEYMKDVLAAIYRTGARTVQNEIKIALGFPEKKEYDGDPFNEEDVL